MYKRSDIPSFRSVFAFEERMSSSGCLLSLVGDRKGDSLKISAPITFHRMYFPSIPLPLLPCLLLLLLSEKDMVCRMVDV